MKNKLILLVLALAFSSGACKQAPIASEKPRLTREVYSIDAEAFTAAEVAPPPAADSEVQKTDIAVVRDWQKKRTQADCVRAEASGGFNYADLWGANDPFRRPLPAELTEFFASLHIQLKQTANTHKIRYGRLRPYQAYADIKPCVEAPASGSYPSWHACFSRFFADMLGDIVPERKKEFKKAAEEIELSRLIGGVHYPTDTEAGEDLAKDIHKRLLKSPGYLKAINDAKTFLVNPKIADEIASH